MTPVDELLVRLFRTPRILVVDDTTSPVEALLHRHYACDVDHVSTGEAAVELLKTHKYDIALVDLELLNGTSTKVVGAASTLCPDTPIVAVRTCACLPALLRTSPLTMLSEPVTLKSLEHLFRMLKFKARTREMAAYCDHLECLHPPQPSAA